MRTSRTWVALAALACAVLLVPGGAWGSVIVNEWPVADYSSDQLDGHVSGDVVVYTDYSAGTADVLGVRSLWFPFAVAYGPGEQLTPDIDGDLVVCVTSPRGNRDLLLFNLTTSSGYFLTDYSGGDEFSPALSGRKVAYIYKESAIAKVRVIDVDLFTERVIATGNGTENMPAFDGDLVAWQTIESGNLNVYASYVGGTPFLVAGTTANERLPSVSGSLIAYIVNSNVAIYDVATGQARLLTNNPGPVSISRVKVAGSHVVWSDNRNGDYDILLHDLKTGEQYALLTRPGN